MRFLYRKIHSWVCMVTGSCDVSPWSLDDLKRDDPAFANHIEWMKEQENRANAERRSRNPIERAVLGEQDQRS